jgi:hypothetical protein
MKTNIEYIIFVCILSEYTPIERDGMRAVGRRGGAWTTRHLGGTTRRRCVTAAGQRRHRDDGHYGEAPVAWMRRGEHRRGAMVARLETRRQCGGVGEACGCRHMGNQGKNLASRRTGFLSQLTSVGLSYSLRKLIYFHRTEERPMEIILIFVGRCRGEQKLSLFPFATHRSTENN